MTTHENEPVSLEEELSALNAEARAEEVPEDLSTAEEVAAETQESAEEPAELTQEEVQDVIEELKAPSMWGKEYREVFDTWGAKDEKGNPLYESGPQWQKRMLDLFTERQAYATQVEQERSAARKDLEKHQAFTNNWQQALSPFQQFIAETGNRPDVLVRNALGLVQGLKQDPKGTLANLIRSTKVDVSDALNDLEYQDPMSQRLNALERQLASQERQRAQAEIERQRHAMQEHEVNVSNQLKTFSEETDENGNLLRPHVNELDPEMATIYLGHERRREFDPSIPQLSLQDLYERALLMKPELMQADRAEKEKQEAIRKASDAKKATDAARKPKSGRAGKEPVPEMTLEEELRERNQQQVA